MPGIHEQRHMASLLGPQLCFWDASDTSRGGQFGRSRTGWRLGRTSSAFQFARRGCRFSGIRTHRGGNHLGRTPTSGHYRSFLTHRGFLGSAADQAVPYLFPDNTAIADDGIPAQPIQHADAEEIYRNIYMLWCMCPSTTTTATEDVVS